MIKTNTEKLQVTISEIFNADSTNIKRIGKLEQLYANKLYNLDEKNNSFKNTNQVDSLKNEYIT